jgi:hypothetical protein
MSSIRERAGALVDHHYDTTNPDKPLWLMFPGGAVGVSALGWAIWVGYRSWFAPRPQPAGLGLLLPLLLYFAGVFVFSYGYELYDTPRAIKLTVKLGLIGLAAVVIIVALAFALGALGKSKKLARSAAGSGVNNAEKMFTGLGRLAANTAFRRRVDITGYIPQEDNVCSYCAQPLPPPGSPTSAALVDPDAFCPKCGQPFEPAGERVKRKPGP